jgi:hypothetical protein
VPMALHEENEGERRDLVHAVDKYHALALLHHPCNCRCSEGGCGVRFSPLGRTTARRRGGNVAAWVTRRSGEGRLKGEGRVLT